jgi:hypothetical protein
VTQYQHGGHVNFGMGEVQEPFSVGGGGGRSSDGDSLFLEVESEEVGADAKLLYVMAITDSQLELGPEI